MPSTTVSPGARAYFPSMPREIISRWIPDQVIRNEAKSSSLIVLASCNHDIPLIESCSPPPASVMQEFSYHPGSACISRHACVETGLTPPAIGSRNDRQSKSNHDMASHLELAIHTHPVPALGINIGQGISQRVCLIRHPISRV